MADEIGQQQNIETAQGVFTTRADAGNGGEGEVKLWMQEIELAEKTEGNWVKRASQTIDIYRDATDRKSKTYNILYANTEVISQAVYNSRGLPDVRARYEEGDPTNLMVAQIIERSLTYATDDSEHDFDQVIKNAVKDVLLPGRCVDRVRYKPHFETRNKRIALVQQPGIPTPEDPMPQPRMQRVDDASYLDPEDEWKTDDQGDYMDGDEYEAITYEECYAEHVQWADFRRGPGKTWEEVPWISFRHYLTKPQVEELNEKIGATIEMDSAVTQDGKYRSADNGTAPSPDVFKRLCVWEIWDKEKRKVRWIAPSYKLDVLRVDDDPLGLAQFFPIPRPILAVEVPETLVPVEPYRLYKDQAEQLDIITRRLTALTRAAKWRGLYAMPEGGTDLTTLQNADDGDLVPSQTLQAVVQKGGSLENAIFLMPIKELMEAVGLLTQRQQAVKNDIYEIMGIADILRGNSESRETATTSRVKSQWGSLRLQHIQQEVQRYIRDIFRLMAEIICEKYQPETLQLITGMQIPPQVLTILRSDALRCFRVDIETDSTIQADLARYQENATAFVSGTAAYFNAIGAAVKGGVIKAESALDIYKGFARLFKLPRQAQEAIEKMQPPPPAPPNPIEQVKSQAEVAKAQAGVEKAKIEGQTAAMEGQATAQTIQMKASADQQKTGMQMVADRQSHVQEMTKLAAQAAQNVVNLKNPGAGV